ncbi:hypothetical protein TUBRATIS_24510 [Tubulinosema ratisbonensis]|uniref:Uncharacterized protein n=1 Tax=Tubulinosema ratisbonensis TaxID=291195 RepID=A0A437AIW9_9MICR|nr:hypothetical protein TUBRATIS_24510 [Tubulinosema ratisbonensis]
MNQIKIFFKILKLKIIIVKKGMIGLLILMKLGCKCTKKPNNFYLPLGNKIKSEEELRIHYMTRWPESITERYYKKDIQRKDINDTSEVEKKKNRETEFDTKDENIKTSKLELSEQKHILIPQRTSQDLSFLSRRSCLETKNIQTTSCSESKDLVLLNVMMCLIKEKYEEIVGEIAHLSRNPFYSNRVKRIIIRSKDAFRLTRELFERIQQDSELYSQTHEILEDYKTFLKDLEDNIHLIVPKTKHGYILQKATIHKFFWIRRFLLKLRNACAVLNKLN